MGGRQVPNVTTIKDPKAWFLKAKVLGAHPFMPGTAGFYVQYRKADAGADAMSMSSPMVWNTPFNWGSPGQGGNAEKPQGVRVWR